MVVCFSNLSRLKPLKPELKITGYERVYLFQTVGSAAKHALSAHKSFLRFNHSPGKESLPRGWRLLQVPGYFSLDLAANVPRCT